jgi:hypothetical protein
MLNSKQKRLLWNLAYVFGITFIFVLSMANFKDFVNKRESMIAMKELGKRIFDYRRQYGSLPSENVVLAFKNDLPGAARLGEIQYRAQWISIDSTSDTILAYDKKVFNWFLVKSGYVVLYLDGRVKYEDIDNFSQVLTNQQSRVEIKDLQDQLKNNATRP